MAAPQNQVEIVANTEKTRSTVWKFFGFAKVDGKTDKGTKICRHCFVKRPYKGQTNMTSHLTKHHYGIFMGKPGPSPSLLGASATAQPTMQAFLQNKKPYAKGNVDLQRLSSSP